MAYGIVWTLTEDLSRWGSQTTGLIASIVVWSLYGLFVGWILYRLQLFKHRPVSAVVAVLFWGAFLANAGSIVGGTALDSVISKWFGIEFASAWSSAMRAPLMEEGLKVLGVVGLALIPRVRFSSVLDGLFYGTIVGLGFTISENILYTNVSIASSGGTDIVGSIISVMGLRGIMGALLGHMVLTGITGAGIGYFVSRRGKPMLGRIAPAVGLFLVGTFFHFLQNSPILESLGPISLFVKGIPALIVLLILARWGRREEREHFSTIAQDLDPALIVARPGDQPYAFTGASVLGVDPADEVVPSVFVSVLVAEGSVRAPDRLVEAWASADRNASTVTIRDVEEGANTATAIVKSLVLIVLGVIVVLGIVGVVFFVRSRRRAKSV